MEEKRIGDAKLVEAHRLSTGLVWWGAIQHLQVELQKLLQDARSNSKTIAEYVMEHAGSGQIPPPFKLRIPKVAPVAVAAAIAGMQAFAIEIILKGALAREGREDVEGHNLSNIWNELSDSVKTACESDLSSRLVAAENVGYRPITKGPVPRTIKDVFARHTNDYMVFRYAQTGTKKKREMRQQLVLRDRLQMLLILCTLEDVIVLNRQPLTSKDEEQMRATGKSVEKWFSEESKRACL